MLSIRSAFNVLLTAALHVILIRVNKEQIMNAAKISIVTLFFLMAVGGIGGVMLAGYTFILHAG